MSRDGRSMADLEQIAVLCDELAALVGAGIPLEAALAGRRGEFPSTLRRQCDTLVENLSRGKRLDEALSACDPPIPRDLEAVVRSAIRSGRLASALEAWAEQCRSRIQLRRIAAVALLYPAAICGVAYAAFVLWTTRVAPVLVPSLKSFGATSALTGEQVHALREWAWLWVPVVPLAILACAVAAWFVWGRPALNELGWYRMVPGGRRLHEATEWATFAGVLSLLVDHDLPLPEAVQLAADSTGNPRTMRAGTAAAAALTKGQTIAEAWRLASGLPPRVGWLLAAGGSRQTVTEGLSGLADQYRIAAGYESHRARVVWPIVATLAVGGTVTLAYALVVFTPVVALLTAAAGP